MIIEIAEHKKFFRKHKFCNVWLSNPELGTWMKKFNNNPYKVIYIACNKIFAAGRSELLKHSHRNAYMINNKKEEKGELKKLLSPVSKEIEIKKAKIVLFSNL